LTGVYVARGHSRRWDRAVDLFELLLNSPADVRVVSQPPWWTLRRLLAALGILCAVLAAVMLWVFQLHRQVETQTRTIRDQIEKHATLEERGRIARELHDTLEQALAGISLQLDGFARTLGELPAESARVLAMARAMVRHGQEEARRTVRNLRTLALEKGDLPGALAQMARNASDGVPIHIEVDLNGTRAPLSSKVESHLLRIGQEATTNALKHARAKNVRLRLRYEQRQVELTIYDDGCGFDAERALPSEAGHFGLLGMRERAEKIGGALHIASQSGAGTTVRVTVPLHQNPLTT
jgi:signal transduction histidine kinase